MITSRAGNDASAPTPIRQSQPSGRTTGSIAWPSRPRKLCVASASRVELAFCARSSQFLAVRRSRSASVSSSRRRRGSRRRRSCASMRRGSSGAVAGKVAGGPDEDRSSRRSACRPGHERLAAVVDAVTARSAATATCSSGSSITNGGVSPLKNVFFSSHATGIATTTPSDVHREQHQPLQRDPAAELRRSRE